MTAEALNPDYESDARRTALDMPIIRFLGIQIQDIAAGAATVVLPARPELCYRDDLFQAGPVRTLGDYAGGLACLTCLPKGWFVSTVDFTLKMLAPARGQKLVARGRVLQSGKTLSVGAADIYSVQQSRETLCATLLVSMRNIAPDLSRDASRPTNP